VTLKDETPLRVQAKSYSNSSAWILVETTLVTEFLNTISLVHVRAFTCSVTDKTKGYV